MNNLYLVSVGAQKDLVAKHCYGDCGKIIIGAIELSDIGFIGIPCNEVNCLYEDKNISINYQHEGKNVYVRKLKDDKN